MNSQPLSSKIPWETSFRYDGYVIALFILTLFSGWILKSWVETRSNVYTDIDGHLSLSYPELWAKRIDKGTLLSIHDLKSEGSYKTSFTVSVTEENQPEVNSLQNLVQTITQEKAQELTSYRVLETNSVRVDNHSAMSILYAYVEDPETNPLQTYLPTVIKGVDILVFNGDKVYLFSFTTPATSFPQSSNALDAIMRSVEFDQEKLQ